jgi:SAM-dependent methyltransferase
VRRSAYSPMSKIIHLLKKLPIDVGQGEKKYDTAGKRIAFSFVEEGTGNIAVDVGCRDGFWTERLKKRGYRVHALDLKPDYPEAITHDIEQGLPFPDRSVDLLWCTEVIEHLYRPDVFLQEVERVMKLGGRAIITTPNSHWWFYWVVRPLGWTPQKLQNPDHKHFFSAQALRELAAGHDLFGYFPYALFFFRITRAVGALSPTFILVRHFPGTV